MKIKKRVLNDALRVLGKVVCQTSPVELYRSIRFVGDERGIRAMAADGVEAVSVAVDAFTESEISRGNDISQRLGAFSKNGYRLPGRQKFFCKPSLTWIHFYGILNHTTKREGL